MTVETPMEKTAGVIRVTIMIVMMIVVIIADRDIAACYGLLGIRTER